MNDTKNKIPEFKSEEDELKFWATADSTEYLDWSSAKRTKFVRLKPSLKTVIVFALASLASVFSLRYGLGCGVVAALLSWPTGRT